MKSEKYVQKSARRVIIHPANSTILLRFLMVTHLVTLVLLLSSNLAVFIQAIIVFMLGINMIRSMRSIARNRHALSFAPGNDLLLRPGVADWRKIRILQSFVTGWLIVIKVVEEGSRSSHSLVYAKDSVSRAQFRLLRKMINQYDEGASR